MKPIQYLLVALIGSGFALYYLRYRNRSRDRLVVLAACAVAIAFVLFPDWTSQLAALVGVGRGADLTLYVAIVSLGLMNIAISSRVRELHLRLTEVARRQAIDRATFAHDEGHTS